jgi:SEFIR domain
MKSEQLTSLLEKIREIQSLMILVATGQKNIQDGEKSYKSLYEQINFEVEILHDEGFKASSINDFTSLWDWHTYYKSSGMNSVERGAYVHDLYSEIITQLETSLCKLRFSSISQDISELSTAACEDLVEIKIEQLKSILLSTTGIDKLRSQENNYQALYRDIDQQIIVWSNVGVLAENPNQFKSLWQWLKYRQEMDDFFAGAKQYIDATYKDFTISIKKALYKARELSYEEFVDELRCHFGKQVPQQFSASTSTDSSKSAENEINQEANSLSQLGSSKTTVAERQGVKSNLTAPKVFISYSHDSQEHKKRVSELAERLRDGGIDCIIDRYEPSPAEGWHRWMLNQIEIADFVLVVCTERYNHRFRGREETGKGPGVTWEGGTIIQELYDSQGQNSKFIPVVFTSKDIEFIPSPLRSTSNYDLSASNGYELIYRQLTNQPEMLKPDLGALRTLPPLNHKQILPEPLPHEASENSSVSESLEASDILNLADLLKRSGRAVSISRRSLCQSLGLDPGELSFVSSPCSDKDFAIELVNYLYETGHDLTKLCSEVKPHLRGQYSQELQIIYDKIQA